MPCVMYRDFFVLITGANEDDGTSTALSQDGSSVISSEQLCGPQLSCGSHATDNAAVKNEALLMMDNRCQMASVEQPICSSSLLLQSAFCDPDVASTTRLFSPIASSSPLPYFVAEPAAVCRLDCDQKYAKPISSRPVCAYTLPVPSDAVLVRPRMPVVAGKHETTSSPPVTAPSLLLLSSAAHGPVDASGQETGSSAATVYGGGFYAPPANSSTSSRTEELAPAASVSCCPHCGVGFVTTAVPRNIIYHPTGSSYVIHSLTPTLQPCYSVTVNSVVVQPAAASTYTAGGAATAQSSPVRLPDAAHQQTCTRLPLPPRPASVSPSFISGSQSVSAVRVRTARPPPSCANCGHIGHTQLDCKQPTIDTVLNARKYK